MSAIQWTLLTLSAVRLAAQAWHGNQNAAILAQQLDAWLRYKASHPQDQASVEEVMDWVRRADEATDEFTQAVIDYANAAGIPLDERDMGGPVDLGPGLGDQLGTPVVPDAPVVPDEVVVTETEAQPEPDGTVEIVDDRQLPLPGLEE